MRSLILLILSALLPAQTIEQIDKIREDIRPLLDAISKVESNDNDDAVGDNGKALGRFQIWEIYWQDAVERTSSISGKYEDVKNREYAERVFVAYMLRYARKAIRDKDYEKIARIHNGGPRGHTKNATIKYWNKVNKILEAK
jgi:hypothetical protein